MTHTQRYLADILDNLERIEAFAADGYEAFMEDDKTQYAIIRAYEVIGEAVKRIPNELLAQEPSVNWQQIKGFRDFLIHSYDKVDLRLIWVAVEDAPTLKAAVQVLQNKLHS